MAKCRGCGVSKMLMRSCEVCRNSTCEDCRKTVFKAYVYHDDQALINVKNQVICGNCYSEFEKEMTAKLQKLVQEDGLVDYCIHCGPSVKLAWTFPLREASVSYEYYGTFPRTVSAAVTHIQSEWVCLKCKRLLLGIPTFFNTTAISQETIKWTETKDYKIHQNVSWALAAERAGRRDDAAQNWENAGFIEKAKDMRDQDRVVHHEHKHVSVDVNRLIEMLSNSNYTIPYKCPSCGAVIKLSKDRGAEAFLSCEYCHCSLKLVDVESLIKQLM